MKRLLSSHSSSANEVVSVDCREAIISERWAEGMKEEGGGRVGAVEGIVSLTASDKERIRGSMRRG